ncbi:MAG: AgmX/PglI C-terminal domain-containing protein [Polyangiaceae bacterium]|nr:AgmX/PglI C-terminal domain-containing protein [Polyangiaceae bacterium]
MSASELPEKKSGSGMYIIGALLLAAGIGAIVVLTGSDDKPPPPPPPPTAIQADNTPPAPAPPPPPPPPVTATASASAEPVATGTGGPKGPPGPGACSNCGQGKSNSSLDSALRAAAGSARGCYNRALQKNAGAAGKLTVNVQVGPSGAVCGASISNDTVGSGEVSTCVLQRFQGKSFPKPDSGCVSVAIPMSFEVKQ